MNCPSKFRDRYLFSEAKAADNPDIAALFAEQNFDGKICLQILRGNQPLSSLELEADRLICLIVRDSWANNRLIGIGIVLIRQGYINGKIGQVGYLNSLKLAADYQKQFLGIIQAYQWIFAAVDEPNIYYYTTILDDNLYVRKMLEKRRKNMPHYHFLGNYYSLIFKCGKKIKDNPYLKVKFTSKQITNHFYQNKVIKHQFAPASLSQNHLQNAQYCGLYRQDKLIACATIYKLNTGKQYLIKGYRGLYRALPYLPTELCGYPGFPKPNQVLDLAAAAIYFEPQATNEELSYFWQTICANYQDAKLLMIGLSADNRLYQVLTKFRHISYLSRLYQVNFGHNQLLDPGQLFDIDISFL